VHLTPEEFVDAVEGTRSEASLPHLAECLTCRRELAGLRSTMISAAEDADVPEPSALFWDNLSARVGVRIDAEPDRRWWLSWARPAVFVPLSAVALLVLVVALAPDWRSGRDRPAPGTRAVPATAAIIPAPGIDAASDASDLAADPLLTLVSDLSANMDLESASDAGLADPDSAERAVTHMNTDELLALKQLLQMELARPGA
jgi:hypothetical protein